MALRQGPTVNELRASARAAGIVGYSKMRKHELEAALQNPAAHRVRKTPQRVHAGPTVKDLRAQAKAAGIKGYSGRNKAELMALLGGRGVAGATARQAAYSPYYGRR